MYLTDKRQRPELLRVDGRGAHDAPVQAGDALPAVEGRALRVALRLDDVDGKLAAHDTRKYALVGAAHSLHARRGPRKEAEMPMRVGPASAAL